MSANTASPAPHRDLTRARTARGVERLPLLAWAVVIVVALAWDRSFWLHVSVHDEHQRALMESKDWYRTLRVLGSVWPWLIVAPLFGLVDLARSTPGWWKRGGYVLASALAGGGGAELLKPIVGRLRPENTQGWFEFAGLAERFTHGSDLGMASSHTGLAFGAAAALARLLPGTWPLLFVAACGTGLTRVLAGAHFLSDCVVGAMLGYACAWAIWRIDPRNRASAPEHDATSSSAIEGAG